jgi:UDP-N-acetylmuramate: L-alanyl-gamma-D-glutamyl-meso-diaminopimelate ligase
MDLKSVHIIGVCGTLMGSFAAFLKRSGVAVTGSDQNVYPPMSDVLREAMAFHVRM